MNIKRNNIALIVSIFTFTLLLTGGTYAWLSYGGSTIGENTQKSEATCFSMDYDWGFDLARGDVDLDGFITTLDHELIGKYMLDPVNYPLSGVAFEQADANYDGEVSNSDSLIIYRYAYYQDPVLGDVNLDGYLTNEDVELIFKYIKDPELYSLSGAAFEQADVNYDGVITNADTLVLLKNMTLKANPAKLRTIRGDVNMDGILTNADVELIQNYISDPVNYSLSGAALEQADVNHSSVINDKDVGLLQQYISLGRWSSLNLFPSRTDKGGFRWSLRFSIKEECNVSANGYIKINVGSDTDRKFFMNSALRYSVYDSDNTTLIESGLLTTYGVKTLNPNNPFTLSKTPNTYYVYIWLDGTKVDNNYLNLPFSATIYGSAVQIES